MVFTLSVIERKLMLMLWSKVEVPLNLFHEAIFPKTGQKNSYGPQKINRALSDVNLISLGLNV